MNRHNNRRVPPPPPQDPSSIKDPFIRDLVAKTQQAPHFSPLPLDKTVSNFDLDGFSRQQALLARAGGVPDPNTVTEIDIDRMLHNRASQQPQYQQQQYQPVQQQQTVSLKEGYPVYRGIQQAFGNTFVLARVAGVVDRGLASQPFVARNQIQAYVIPPNQTQVNIQEIQQNPRLLTNLVEIHSTPMSGIGTLLVQREAINIQGQQQFHHQQQQQRNVLTDDRRFQPQGRTLLKG